MKINKGIGLIILSLGTFPCAVTALDVGNRHELVLSGAVESVDRTTNTVSVLGNRFVVRNASALNVGKIVNVFGRIGAPSFGLSTISDTGVYSSGADSVLIRGRVTALDVATGRVQIDGSAVDYTALLADSSFVVPTLGGVFEVVGVQPRGRGSVLASSIARLTENANGTYVAAGITGVGLVSSQGITGVGAAKAAGITGVGLVRNQGITGVGAARAVGITGVGLVRGQGITGVGLVSSQGITGVGAAKVAGITGVGLVRSQGITGVGVVRSQGITGVGLANSAGITGVGSP
jgi:hypothetical protein